MKIGLAIAAGVVAGSLVAACSAKPRQEAPVAPASANPASTIASAPARQDKLEATSRDPAGCAVRLLRGPVVVRAAPRRDASVLARLDAPRPLFFCERQVGWRRVLFAELPQPASSPVERSSAQFHDCLTRAPAQACRAGWIDGEPRSEIPG